MNDQAIQYAEVSLEEAKAQVALKESIHRLERNRDFRKVILEGYFRDEPARLTGLLAEPKLTAEQKADVLTSLRAIGELRQYFIARLAIADQAEKALEDYEEELVRLRNEEDSE